MAGRDERGRERRGACPTILRGPFAGRPPLARMTRSRFGFLLRETTVPPFVSSESVFVRVRMRGRLTRERGFYKNFRTGDVAEWLKAAVC
jgi:hypothetical protein